MKYIYSIIIAMLGIAYIAVAAESPDAKRVHEVCELILKFPGVGTRFDFVSHLITPEVTCIECDLKKIDLSAHSPKKWGLALSGADLRGSDLTQADFSGARMSHARMDESPDSGKKTMLTKANMSGTDISNAFMNHVEASEINLKDANASNAVLIEANLPGAHCEGTDFSRAWLTKANMQGAYFDANTMLMPRGKYFKTMSKVTSVPGAQMHETDLRGAHGLTNEQLEYAKKEGALLDADQLKQIGQE